VLANLELRRRAGGKQATEIYFAGHKYQLTTDRIHSIDLLLSTYETAVYKNLELSKVTEKLEQQAQELRVKNEQMQDDLAMARELQTAFLPRHYPVFPANASPERSAIQFCHRYTTTTELGGDFFDILAISDTAAGVLVCDVMGHGVRSALIAAIVRGLVEELKAHVADPGRFLAELNRSLCGILKQTMTPIFTTATYVVADLATGELRHASAGHPAPFHLRRGVGTLATLAPPGGKSGPALGVFEGAVYATGRQELASGDMVMLFTDGAYEIEGADGVFYEKDQMQAAVERRLTQPAPQLFDELVMELKAFSKDHDFDDDVCLVGMEVVRLMPGGR
jgi:sigma-B regulation protein RsbU (phosphoserine phosphatase)